MLSKQTFLPTKSLFVAASIAACGLAAVQQSANALSISFENRVGDDYNYVIDVDPVDSWTTANTVEFTNLIDVTGQAVSGAVAGFFATNGTTSTSASFVPTFDLVPGLNGNLARFTITSTAAPGSVNVDFNGFSASLTGPAVNSVPFEFSPGLGLFLSGTIFGALKLRSKFSPKEKINL